MFGTTPVSKTRREKEKVKEKVKEKEKVKDSVSTSTTLSAGLDKAVKCDTLTKYCLGSRVSTRAGVRIRKRRIVRRSSFWVQEESAESWADRCS